MSISGDIAAGMIESEHSRRSLYEKRNGHFVCKKAARSH